MGDRLQYCKGIEKFVPVWNNSLIIEFRCYFYRSKWINQVSWPSSVWIVKKLHSRNERKIELYKNTLAWDIDISWGIWILLLRKREVWHLYIGGNCITTWSTWYNTNLWLQSKESKTLTYLEQFVQSKKSILEEFIRSYLMDDSNWTKEKALFRWISRFYR